MSFPKRNLVLVGPTGAGKTSIGKMLAQALDWQFIDLDRLIERRVGASIPQIFAEKDEPYFRKRESEALVEALAQHQVVIATGAGCVLSETNRQRMRELGCVVYLQLDVEQQLQRLKRDTTRPLLQRSDREQVLWQMAQVRDPLYADVAHLTFHNTIARSSRAACAQLLTQMKYEWHD